MVEKIVRKKDEVHAFSEILYFVLLKCHQHNRALPGNFEKVLTSIFRLKLTTLRYWKSVNYDFDTARKLVVSSSEISRKLSERDLLKE